MFDPPAVRAAEALNQSNSTAAPSPAGNSSGAQQPPDNLASGPLSENDLDQIVNVTREYPFDYAMVMFGYLMPFVLVVTLVTNLLVVLVLYKRHMRTPTNIVLFTMAIVDLGTLLSPSPWYLYIYTFDNHQEFLYPPSACYLHHIMTDVVPVFFHTSSIWLALLLASQRYVYVCHPTMARTWCTVPRVKRAILLILVIAFLHQLSRFFDNTFVPVRVRFNQTEHMACKNEIAAWVRSIDIAVYYSTYFIFRIFFVFLFPCVALITLNTLLFRALKRAENKRTQLLKTKFRVVGADPTQAERHSQLNFSITGYGLGREASSYAGPVTGGCGASNGQRTTVEGRALGLPAGGDGGQGEAAAEPAHGRGSPSSSGDARPSSRAGLLDSRARSPDDDRPVTTDLDREHPLDTKRPPGGAAEARPTPSSGSREPTTRSRDDEGEAPAGRSSPSSSAATNSRSNTNDEFTCLECAAYEADCHSRRSSDEGQAIDSCEHQRPGGPRRPHLHHQPLSQCSSILGGATNTTTNEDDLSSATQNHSSSMFAPLDETAPESRGAGAPRRTSAGTAVQGGEEEDELSFGYDDFEDDSRLARRDNRRARLPTAGSVESRLACGCPTAMTTAARQAAGLLGRSKFAGRDGCPSVGARRRVGHSHSMNECQDQAAKCCAHPAAGRGRRGPNCCGPACSNSDPCIRGHERSRPAAVRLQRQRHESGRARVRGALVKSNSGLRSAEGSQPTMRSSASLLLAAVSTDGSGAPANSLTSKRPSPADGRNNTHSSRHELFSHERHHTNGQPATATTTTTLYSANTNSVCSLLQAQAAAGKPAPGPCSAHSACGRQRAQEGLLAVAAGGGPCAGSAPPAHGRPPHGRTKSPSFASCTTGRGSRATLLGGSLAVQPLLASGPQSNIQAAIPVSARSMDSNRTTLMLVVVVTVFLIVEVPVALVTILHVVLNTFDVFKDIEFTQWLNYIKLFTNFFIMISYSVNFTIYCSMSKKFRETFRDLFRPPDRKRTKRIFSQSQAQHSQCNPAGHCAQINHQFAPGASNYEHREPPPAAGAPAHRDPHLRRTDSAVDFLARGAIEVDAHCPQHSECEL